MYFVCMYVCMYVCMCMYVSISGYLKNLYKFKLVRLNIMQRIDKKGRAEACLVRLPANPRLAVLHPEMQAFAQVLKAATRSLPRAVKTVGGVTYIHGSRW